MCGIVGYFGGAVNNLTRLLTAMSAIIYRAPDSTGIGFFGDDREPIRLRKSLGTVVQLIDVLRTEGVYCCAESLLHRVAAGDIKGKDEQYRQQALLDLEGFEPRPPASQEHRPTFDDLVNLQAEEAVCLTPGCAGKDLFQAQHRIRSRKDLAALIQSWIAAYDLSPLTIHTLMRSALAETAERRRRDAALTTSNEEILAAFDDLFETTREGTGIRRLRRRAAGQIPRTPRTQKQLWLCLIDTTFHIPADFNRDGVCCLFRLLDAALLSRLPAEPGLAEALDQKLDVMWPRSRRPQPTDWRTLYAAEKGLNVYGRAAAAALAHLQHEVFSPAVTADMARHTLTSMTPIVPGRTDPLLLRYLATPIIAHGRWAMQSAVTKANAHPFMDARRQRALALNGQFDSRIEARLHTFLTSVGGYRLRSDNSAEYVAWLWSHFFDQLRAEQRRSDLVRRQVEKEMADIAICSQSIDFNVYHRVRGLAPAEIDRIAFVSAVRQIVQNGGQIAVIGISLVSPRRVYVASHNRPVFIVRRVENDDFMVVSDINAAMGLFPQALIERTINALNALKQRQAGAAAQLAMQGADREALRAGTAAFALEHEALLAPFTVEVYPLDGEEIFAQIETGLEGGNVRRTVSIGDFSGNALAAEVEPFKTQLDPVTVRKDIDISFHESHLREVPDRFRYILNVYTTDAGGMPSIDLRTRVLHSRFGRRLEGLRRLILVGAGSAFHMAVIARGFLAELMPELAVDAARPDDIEDPKRRIVTQQDLVIMLSWSSTTAEMVQLAHRLLGADTLMIAITEKSFADMALAARKSAGVMPVYSGEEVTIAGIKSTLCMLLCLHLLSTWICREKGMPKRLKREFGHLTDLADRIERLNDDADVVAFSQQTAAAMAGADAVMVATAPEISGIGREIALKLEEAGWYAVGKWYGFDDILAADPCHWSPGRFAIVHATRRAHIDAAMAVMQKLAEAGIGFAVVTCPNRHRRRIDQLSGGRCLVLPWTDDGSQPYIDLAFYYRLALDLGYACGHGNGTGPRNRTKSSTVARSRPKTLPTPAAELKRLSAAAPISVEHDPAQLEPSAWEQRLNPPEALKFLAHLRWLADQLQRDDPPAGLGIREGTGTRRLGEMIFDAHSEINDLTIAPCDAAAGAVVEDAAAVWRRLIDLPLRVLPVGEWPRRVSDGTLVLMVATQTDRGADGRDLPAMADSRKTAWLGPQPPAGWEADKATAGRFILPGADGKCSPALLYAGLNWLFADAWCHAAPEKAAIVRRHIAAGADAVAAVLNDIRLLDGLQAVGAASAGYRSAFFISPLVGSGKVWERQFDRAGRLTLVHHGPGHCSHGPIVTIDGKADEKYVSLAARAEMLAHYGESDVARWERDYLEGDTIDAFLKRAPAGPLMRPRAPFYADNRWYLPELQPDYDPRHDNLIILDMTAERDLPRMLDELSLLGSRLPRLVVITQQARIREAGRKTLFSFPISELLVLPAPHDAPIADMHLPYVLDAIGATLAAAWETGPERCSPTTGDAGAGASK
jgi:glucosamine 6-phosphate synthetase-like amidotransferase/phosphosugar isomerase protein